jgi:aromatic-amino-acid transaminase
VADVTVLTTPELRASWIEELTEMRERIRKMRSALVDRLQAHGASRDFSFVRQNGMFSYSGLTAEQVDRLREEFHIYAVSTGRICVAALNSRNVDYRKSDDLGSAVTMPRI